MKFTEDLELQAWSERPFASETFRAEAFANPRYRTDPHFRDAVAKKLAISPMGIEPKVYNDTESLEIVSGGLGTSGTEASERRIAEQKSVEEIHAEQFGALSVRPEARAKTQTPTTRNVRNGALEETALTSPASGFTPIHRN